jgi:pimeloyl-ACP methyl ester carboxylesterase
MPLQIDCLFRSGTKGAVLYIEGMGCSMSDFAPAFTHPALKDYTLAAFDFPGMGTSPYPCGSHLDIDDLAEVTDTAASALGLERFVITGHSMGGAVALLYAEKYRPRTAGFINIEGNLAAEDCFFSRKIAQLNSADQVKRTAKTDGKTFTRP